MKEPESAAAALEPGAARETAPVEGEPTTITLPLDQLPKGLKAGDTLRCTGRDEAGATFEVVSGKAPPEDEERAWKEDFRKAMSPREQGTEAM